MILSYFQRRKRSSSPKAFFNAEAVKLAQTGKCLRRSNYDTMLLVLNLRQLVQSFSCFRGFGRAGVAADEFAPRGAVVVKTLG